MTARLRGDAVLRGGGLSHVIATIFVSIVTLATPVVAQTVPYESGQRGRYGSGLGQTDLPSGGTFEPRIDAAIQYVANIELVADGEPQIDMAGLELAPGFYASYSSGSAVMAIDYSLIGRAWEESDYDDVSHRLAANGEWIAVPEWFSLSGDARYWDGIIDPMAGLNYGRLGVFNPSNLEEVATASISPVLQHRFNELEFVAQYRDGRVWYLDQGKGQPTTSVVENRDSRDQSADVTLDSAGAGSRLSAGIFYNWQKSEYDESLLPYEVEMAGISVGFQVLRSVTLVGDYGLETDLQKRVADGGLEEAFWNAGLRWTPNERTSAEARYGRYSYGDSYSFSAEHRARQLELRASYSERPTVGTQRLSLGEVVPGELPPGIPDIDLGIFNSRPYILRDGRIGATVLGSRTKLAMTGFWYERDYLPTQGFLESGYGASVTATRQLASNLSTDFTVYYGDFERTTETETVLEEQNRDTQAILRFSRQSGAKLTLTAESGYLMRSGDADYDGWWVAMRARWTP